MTRYIALLRAVNVGGTGKLPMSELKAMCCDAGFARVETYIASGNVVFESKAAPSRVKAELEGRLQALYREARWCCGAFRTRNARRSESQSVSQG